MFTNCILAGLDKIINLFSVKICLRRQYIRRLLRTATAYKAKWYCLQYIRSCCIYAKVSVYALRSQCIVSMWMLNQKLESHQHTRGLAKMVKSYGTVRAPLCSAKCSGLFYRLLCAWKCNTVLHYCIAVVYYTLLWQSFKWDMQDGHKRQVFRLK